MTPDWFGSPDLIGHVALVRWALVGTALLWAATVARAPRLLALLVGVLFVFVAAGFWTFGLGRPYGLLEDAAATRRAAEVSVAAATGRADESFVAGEPIASGAFIGLLKTGLSPETLKVLPSLMPALTVGAVGLLVFALWARRGEALAGACLWLAFCTGDLESARGLGVLPGTWPRPESALALPVLVAAALLAARLPGRFGVAAAALAGLAPLALAAPVPPPGVPDALLLLTLDQMPWIALGALGSLRAPDAASLGLVSGGGLAVLLSAVGATGDAWAAQALFRLGLLLACCSPALWRPLAAAARALSPRLEDLLPGRLVPALVLATFVPGSFATWWDPVRVDPVAHASQEPISPAIAPLMAFVRERTPRDAVFVASPDYAPALAVFGGRRVLRAPSVFVTADDQRRLRAEGAILAGRPIPPGGDGYGARFVLLAPGDFKARGITRPEDLAGRPGFRMLYADGVGYRVYEVVR